MKPTGPIPVEGTINAFPREGRPVTGHLSGLIDEYGHPRRAWPAGPMIPALLPALIRELDAAGPLHEAYATRLASLLVVELGRIVAVGLAAPDSDPASSHLATFLTNLEGRCDEPWTLATMASTVGLKRTQFAAYFKHHTGDTPIRYLNRLRVERARKLLLGTHRPITDIAFDCGFSSCQYFASVFLEFTGLSASAYRSRSKPSQDRLRNVSAARHSHSGTQEPLPGSALSRST